MLNKLEELYLQLRHLISFLGLFQGLSQKSKMELFVKIVND